METRPTRADDVIFFPSGEDLCLHNMDSGEYYLLNGVAQDVWNRCNGELTVDQIAAGVAAEYDVPSEQAEADVRELVGFLDAEECLL